MNIGWAEFLVIAIIGLVVFGPERLPEMSAQLARFVKSMRVKASSATAELTGSVDTKVVTDLAKDLRGITPRGMAANAMSTSMGKAKSGAMRDQRPSGTLVNPVFDPDAT
ncbi:MAG: twin-arginine translocase subunit TatB [Actinomycetota bacterium]|jgi:sec-independent protein translocase protein TatB